MHTLYPDISPYKLHTLDVDTQHRLYVEESGNPQGIPVLFVHGGPGGGTTPQHRCFFDPERYRIVLFDQRGCGRSTPHAELNNNTTDHLIEDIEKIRQHLNIDQFLLFGGSWGATLSLLYAQLHPERVSGLILRGVFLCRREDIQWLYQQGASAVFPDYWQEYIREIPESEHDDLLTAYYQRLTSDNEIARMSAAKALSVWEGRCSTLDPKPNVIDHYSDPYIALAMARLEAHYFVNEGFISSNQILEQAERISEIPTVIVHGRYDMVCPLQQAYALYQALPQAELHIVRDAGHSLMEPGNIDNLIKATKAFSLSLA